MDDFKPIDVHRRRKRKENISVTSPGRKRKVSTSGSGLSTNAWCPLCQLEFANKCSRSIVQHIETCSGAKENADECPKGSLCREKNIGHYFEYSHFNLALMRSQSTSKSIKVEQCSTSFDRVEEYTKKENKSKTCESVKIECTSLGDSFPNEHTVTDSSELIKIEEVGDSHTNFQNTKIISNREVDCDSSASILPSSSSSSIHKKLSCGLRGQITLLDEIVISKSMCVKQNVLSHSCDCNKSIFCEYFECESHVDVIFCTERTLKDSLSSWAISESIELQAVYNQYGWKKINVCCPSEFELKDFQLLLGQCCHLVEINCILGRKKLSQGVSSNVKTLAFFDFTCLGLNNSDTPEKHVSQILSLDYLEHSMKREHETSVNKVDDVSIVGKTDCEQILDNSCDLNLSIDSMFDDIDDKLIIESSHIINSKNDSKEKWKNIFKKKSTSPVIPDPPIQQFERQTNKKQCPFYKRIPGTSFAVDAFQYGVIPGVSHYFLTHFHYDHYIGLTKGFKQTIICSNVTAALVAKRLRVEPKYLQVVKCTETFTIKDVHITPLDANHCPGSLMFLFHSNAGKSYIHVGDFRAHLNMQLYPAFSNINVDVLFLDTTYCNPQYEFPSQEEVVEGVVRICKKYLRLEPATLIVSGTYTIGKEKVFIGIAKALDSNIWAPKSRQDVLKCLHDKFIDSKLVEYPCKARVHVWPMTSLNHLDLEQHLKDCSKVFKRILAFSPSGWNFKKHCAIDDAPATTRGRVTIIGVPYSEHSSFSELRTFVKFLKPNKVVPTVAPKNRSFSATSQLCNKWLTEKDDDPSLERQQKITSFLKNEIECNL